MLTRYPGMGMVVARAWTDPPFKVRLLADATMALGELGVAIPDGMAAKALENDEDVVHLVLSSPPIVTPSSLLSDICDYGVRYRHPSLWSLNWLGRDPVASRRFLDDPAAALERLGVRVPVGLTVRGVANAAEAVHLILPATLPANRITAGLLANLTAGFVPLGLRLGRLFGRGMYELAVETLATPRPAAGALG